MAFPEAQVEYAPGVAARRTLAAKHPGPDTRTTFGSEIQPRAESGVEALIGGLQRRFADRVAGELRLPAVKGRFEILLGVSTSEKMTPRANFTQRGHRLAVFRSINTRQKDPNHSSLIGI